MLTVKDLTEKLGVGRDTAYALMRAKGFPSFKIGKRYFVSEEALEEWIKGMKNRNFVL